MKEWIMSANPDIYDHRAAFEKQGYIDWKQTRNFEIGDIVYIYCTRPVSSIRYKTVVEKINQKPYIDAFWKKEISTNELGDKCMRLVLVATSSRDELSLPNLRQHGLKYPPQSPGIIRPELSDYIVSLFEKGDPEND